MRKNRKRGVRSYALGGLLMAAPFFAQCDGGTPVVDDGPPTINQTAYSMRTSPLPQSISVYFYGAAGYASIDIFCVSNPATWDGDWDEGSAYYRTASSTGTYAHNTCSDSRFPYIKRNPVDGLPMTIRYTWG